MTVRAGQSPPDRGRLDEAFQALSDANRRSMLERLSLGPASVSELAEPLTISLPAVVQHVQVLAASGLIRSHKRGRVRTCSMETGALRGVEGWVAGRRSEWEGRLDRLGEVVSDG